MVERAGILARMDPLLVLFARWFSGSARIRMLAATWFPARLAVAVAAEVALDIPPHEVHEWLGLNRDEWTTVTNEVRHQFHRLQRQLAARDAALDAVLRAELAARDAALDAVLRAELSARDAALRAELAARDAALGAELAVLRAELSAMIQGRQDAAGVAHDPVDQAARPRPDQRVAARRGRVLPWR